MKKSIMQEGEPQCYLCGKRINLERHHVMAGTANRKLSEKYGLWVWLDHDCHTGTEGAQYDRNLNLLLKQEAQKAFEKQYSHELWMDIFRKNYM